MNETRNMVSSPGNACDSMRSCPSADIDSTQIDTADRVGVLTSAELQTQIELWRNDLRNIHVAKATNTMEFNECIREHKRVVSLICRGMNEQIRRMRDAD